MHYLQRLSTVASCLALALLLASCGSTAETGTDPVNSNEPSAPRPESISERDISEARSAFESAKADWENSGTTDYTLEVEVVSIGLVRAEVVDGQVVSEEIEGTEVDEWFAKRVPRTVDGLFDELDEIIALFEDDPSKIPADGDCGYHMNARLDSDLGYPTYYDTLGPCDDGVGLTARVIQSK